MTKRWASRFVAVSVAAASWQAGAAPPHAQPLYRHEATRLSMACVYAIEAYDADRQRLARVVEEAFDEVDRIDRLDEPLPGRQCGLSTQPRGGASARRASNRSSSTSSRQRCGIRSESGGAFDITVGPLMKAWGFFRGEGHMPSDEDLRAARGHVGGHHVTLNPAARTIAFDEAGVEIDLGGIAKGYAVDRVAALLRERQVACRPDQRRRQQRLWPRRASRTRRPGRWRLRIR